MVHGTHRSCTAPKEAQRPPLPPFICCFDTFGACEPAGRGYETQSVSQSSSNSKEKPRHLLEEQKIRRQKTHLRPLRALLLRLLRLLRLRDRTRPSARPLLLTHIPQRSDHRQIRANDPPLVLHCLPRLALRALFCQTLFVHASVDLGPGDLARILALEEEGLVFRGCEAEDLYSGL